MPDQDSKAARLERLKRLERLILIPILLVVVGAFFSFGRVVVVGQSMLPTLKPGQRVTILKTWRLFSPLKVGDIVVIGTRDGKKNRDEDVVKRIVFIQNAGGSRTWPQRLNTVSGSYPTTDLFHDEHVSRSAKGGIYVLGDNINNSTDSRDFGAVYESEVIGKVLQ
ncbi:signal peptidase I [Armatimonas rosea]|uniref:Signal peptidase I n=1 Tax=Armatimonas rosea TaxID=685828 RepID=A0A7W9W6Y5_ARMRO|nr:signal peptidase I [Armatimonas rosea]MBB6050550.1 signal peptidase I [Armatimonas rosea]